MNTLLSAIFKHLVKVLFFAQPKFTQIFPVMYKLHNVYIQIFRKLSISYDGFL